jgi:hypothetical protein
VSSVQVIFPSDLHTVAIEKAQHSHSWGHSCSWANWITGILGIGKHLQCWKHQEPHAQCPHWGDGPEDMLHVLACPAADAHWSASWTNLVDHWGAKKT